MLKKILLSFVFILLPIMYVCADEFDDYTNNNYDNSWEYESSDNAYTQQNLRGQTESAPALRPAYPANESDSQPQNVQSQQRAAYPLYRYGGSSNTGSYEQEDNMYEYGRNPQSYKQDYPQYDYDRNQQPYGQGYPSYEYGRNSQPYEQNYSDFGYERNPNSAGQNDSRYEYNRNQQPAKQDSASENQYSGGYWDDEESPEFVYPSPKSSINQSAGQSTSQGKGVTIPSPKTSEDYVKIYNELEPANFSYMHGIDPDQYYDIKDTTWAPYPLLRLNSYIYFKNQAIEPGYYLITPREYKDKWYMLFKQNGKVAHIIPVYSRELVPEGFYDSHLPKPKLTPSQKIHMGFLSFLGKFDSSKRRDPVKSYMEINDLDNYFVSIIIYYGPRKYSTIFRTIRL